MATVHDIIPEEQINQAWGNASFGDGTDKKKLIANALLKYACGYTTGHTIAQICKELSLIKISYNMGRGYNTYTLTKLGKEYLYEYFKEVSM